MIIDDGKDDNNFELNFCKACLGPNTHHVLCM